MNRRAILRSVFLLILAGILAWRVFAPPHSPATQPPLHTLTAEDVPAFRAAFNDAAGKVRMILLLSPT